MPKAIPMKLSERFLNLLNQQLTSYKFEAEIDSLVVYIAQSRDDQAPTLEAVGQWPFAEKALPPVELDPSLRAPSADRRWYPLQDGSILLGVLRVERVQSDETWSDSLDQRLQATALSLAQCLGLELDRRRLLDELTQKREQISLMVHQLRNPLTALRTYAQLLLRRIDPENKDRDLVVGLLAEQAQLNRYISALDLLGQEKLPSQESAMSPLLLPPVLADNSSISFRTLLEPLIDRAAARAKLQGREWIGPSFWPEWADKVRPLEEGIIAEIVANLLENAFIYSDKLSGIGLYLKDEGICVWDEGTPIRVEDRESIFDKGFRGVNSSNKSGSGLGLSLGRKLANNMGASLKLIDSPREFDNQLPPIGNAFVVYFSKDK